MLKIINVPDKTLRKKSREITTLTPNLLDFIQELGQTLQGKTDPPGVGLSAIQVGEPQRVFVSYLPKDKSLPADQWTPDKLQLIAHINPEITATSEAKTLGGNEDRPSLEGCLSIPHIYGPVYRHEWIELTYYTLPTGSLPLQGDSKTPPPLGGGARGGWDKSKKVSDLKKTTKRYTGFAARVMQHEQDHLDGILFTDYILKDDLELYFEEGNDLVEIDNPQEIIKW